MNLQSRTGNWTTVTEEGSWRSFDTGKKLIFLVTQEQLDFLWRKKANWTSCGTGRKLKPVLTTGRKLVVSRKLGTKMTGISQLTCFCAHKSAWKLSSSFWEHMRVDKNAWQPFIYLFLFFLLIFFLYCKVAQHTSAVWPVICAWQLALKLERDFSLQSRKLSIFPNLNGWCVVKTIWKLFCFFITDILYFCFPV